MNDNDDMPTTLLTQIVDALEEHTKILQAHKQLLDKTYEQLLSLTKRVEKLEEGDSLNPSDTKFLREITARMKSIATTLEQRA